MGFDVSWIISSDDRCHFNKEIFPSEMNFCDVSEISWISRLINMSKGKRNTDFLVGKGSVDGVSLIHYELHSPKKCSCDQHKIIMINIRAVDFKTDTQLSVDKIQNANLFSLLAQRLTMLICWYLFFSINLNMIFFIIIYLYYF